MDAVAGSAGGSPASMETSALPGSEMSKAMLLGRGLIKILREDEGLGGWTWADSWMWYLMAARADDFLAALVGWGPMIGPYLSS